MQTKLSKAIICPTKTPCRILFEEARKQKISLTTCKELADFTTISIINNTYVAAPVFGKASINVIAELLIEKYAIKEFTIFGSAGTFYHEGRNNKSLQMRIGDIFYPHFAINCFESLGEVLATKLIPNCSQSQIAFEDHCRKQLCRKQISSSHSSGILLTTELPITKSPDNLHKELLANCNYNIAVDMEYFYLSQICKEHEVDLLSAFVISDIISEQRTTGFTSQAYKSGLKMLSQAILLKS